MLRKKKHQLQSPHGFNHGSIKDDDRSSQDTLMESPVWNATASWQYGSGIPSWNKNNNGKHNLKNRKSSSDIEGSAEVKKKGVMKVKKLKGRTPENIMSPTSRKPSKENLLFSMEEAKIVSPTRTRYESRDLDDSDKFPAEYIPPSVENERRRSSAHRVSYRKAIQKAGYNMNELDVGGTTGGASPIVQRKAMQCLTEIEWSKSGPRKKCNACHIVVHDACYPQLLKIGFQCKVTFRESTSKSMRENLIVHHHWVHRRKMEGKCRFCGKSFEKIFGFREPTKIIAISCSWCKESYHNKVSCFQMHKISEPCNLGSLAKSIVPPTWIIKYTQRSKSMKGRSKKKKMASSTWRRKSAKDSQRQKTFIIRPLSQQTSFVSPTLVFINPKSGGKQGSKLLQQFQWYLNPRQICDLSKGGPQEPLELYRKVPNLRILACGGDGTVGWILSVLDKLNLPNAPPVGILPLGTGNDLSRTLNFGAGYSESDSITKILQGIGEARMVKLDRWKLVVLKGKVAPKNVGEDENSHNNQTNHGEAVDDLPLNIVNNYFSIGSDAQVSLSFHNRREAKPEKFTSRLGNKMFYAKAGVLEYVMREAKNLYRNTSLLCDGVDYTWKIRETKPVCILFLNISRYSSGCVPWGNPTGNEFLPQSHDDKLIEVLAFGIHQLGMALVGGHGERICQCKEAYVRINKPYPIQVDGEPCLLNPSTIKVEFFNQANMLYKGKRSNSVFTEPQVTQDPVKIRVNVIQAQQFIDYNSKKDPLCTLSTPLLVTVVMNHSTLDTVRSCLLLMMNDEERPPDPVSEKWIFLDSSSSDKFYKIDRRREDLLTVSDIINSDREVYILDTPRSSTSHGNLHERPRSQLAEKQALYRNRVRSDSGVMASSLESFSDITRSEGHEEDFQFRGMNEKGLPESTSPLDVVFEEPEVIAQEAVVESVKSPGCDNNDDDDDDDATISVEQIIVKESVANPPAGQKDPSVKDEPVFTAASNDMTYEDQRYSTPLFLRPPLLKTSQSTPDVSPEQILSTDFASQLTFASSNGKKNKKKTHKRSNSDTNPKKTAKFTFSPSQLLGLPANKNNSNNNIKKCPENEVKTIWRCENCLEVGRNTGISAENNQKLHHNVEDKSWAEKAYLSTNARRKSSADASDNKISVFRQEKNETVHTCNKIFLNASKRGDLVKITSSVKQGADLCVYDDEGYTALHHAVRFAHADIVDYLLSQGNSKLLDLKCKSRGQTALHKAAWFARAELCKILVKAGASLDVLDYKGMTPSDSAREAEDKELVAFLSSLRMKKTCETEL